MTMPDAGKSSHRKRSRCAIYTRKSTDEGLEQNFNSLDAQREACAAFIQSQRHEGWTLLTSEYDDGGYSGGAMDRPGLQRLLTDIEAGRVDVVVVYKVDRLTRSLADFAKLVEIFDRRGVSFVSITQQFNTTTSMGRLTLNILLSFAQFERELTGERIRDKIAASRKKGIWMGGTVPLGYDVKDRKLVVNKAEARTVADIYRRYLRIKSVRDLKAELDATGIRSKHRIRPDGTECGNQKFSLGSLYLVLQNRTYRGEATHKGNAYPGEHDAIIDKPLWDAVQVALAGNRVERSTSSNAKAPSLLTGLLFDEAGERLSPTWTVKKGTRYRYYVSASLVRGHRKSRSTRHRIPAGDLENAVIERLRAFLSSRAELLDAFDGQSLGRGEQGHMIECASQIAKEFGQPPERNRATIAALVRRIEVGTDNLKIDLSQNRLLALLASDAVEQDQNRPIDPADPVMTLTTAIHLKRVGREMRLLVEGPNDTRDPDMGLLRIIARAHDIHARLAENTKLTVHDVAREENLTAGYIYVLLRLRWLAPDITAAIVSGQQPLDLHAQKLMRMATHFPADWAEQRALLGFR